MKKTLAVLISALACSAPVAHASCVPLKPELWTPECSNELPAGPVGPLAADLDRFQFDWTSSFDPLPRSGDSTTGALLMDGSELSQFADLLAPADQPPNGSAPWRSERATGPVPREDS